MAIHIQCHARVNKQTTLLDGVDIGPPNCAMWLWLNLIRSWGYGQHLKCKGLFKFDTGKDPRTRYFAVEM